MPWLTDKFPPDPHICRTPPLYRWWDPLKFSPLAGENAIWQCDECTQQWKVSPRPMQMYELDWYRLGTDVRELQRQRNINRIAPSGSAGESNKRAKDVR